MLPTIFRKTGGGVRGGDFAHGLVFAFFLLVQGQWGFLHQSLKGAGNLVKIVVEPWHMVSQTAVNIRKSRYDGIVMEDEVLPHLTFRNLS